MAIDLAEAARYYKLAADQGDAYGQNDVAQCYASGKGVAIDLAEAKRYYELAAAQGHPDAVKALARLPRKHGASKRKRG